MNDFIVQFLLESREQVEQATADLLALEKAPEDEERRDSVFRAFHTLKGGAGIVDFAAMERAVHAAEDVLAALRSGVRAATAPLIGDCLACLDQVSRWLDEMERTGELPLHPEVEAGMLIERLARTAGEQSPAEALLTPSATGDWTEVLGMKFATLRPAAHTAIRDAPAPGCFFESEDPLARIAALPGFLCVDIAPVSPWPTLDALDPFTCNVVLTALTRASPVEVVTALGQAADECTVLPLATKEVSHDAAAISLRAREVLEAQILLLEETAEQGLGGRIASAGLVAANVLRNSGSAAAADEMARMTEESLAESAPARLRDAIVAVLTSTSPLDAAPDSPASASRSPTVVSTKQDMRARTLRVDASRIDALVTLTGELTVAKNAIGHVVELSSSVDNEFAALLRSRHAVLDRLVGELQRSVVGMRVLPLRHVFQRLPRLLREISADLGKPAELTVEGGETEADKAIVEALFEPLLHVLRNAMDHGIENKSTRVGRGKPVVGAIRLRAERQGEHVVVEVSDDGAGIDLERVRQVARDRNLVSEELLAAMSDMEVVNLIFAPGFSTATEVTDLSGRGVGMDAARQAVDRLGGRVAIKSQAGQGTTVQFTLPFSVIITRVMVVNAGEQTFGIPLDSVVETVRVRMDQIASIGSAQAVILTNRTLPLIELTVELGLAKSASKGNEATIVVTRIDGHYGAMRVDRIGARMDVMLKPLDGLLAGTRGIAGSTLLGDGSVLLILAPAELFH